MNRPAYDAWKAHLDPCPTCRKAIRGRFAGSTPEQMHKNCCEEGKPLYGSFLNECKASTEGSEK